jgi:hypothetical protein
MREAVIKCKVASENTFSSILMIPLHPSSPLPQTAFSARIARTRNLVLDTEI